MSWIQSLFWTFYSSLVHQRFTILTVKVVRSSLTLFRYKSSMWWKGGRRKSSQSPAGRTGLAFRCNGVFAYEQDRNFGSAHSGVNFRRDTLLPGHPCSAVVTRSTWRITLITVFRERCTTVRGATRCMHRTDRNHARLARTRTHQRAVVRTMYYAHAFLLRSRLFLVGISAASTGPKLQSNRTLLIRARAEWRHVRPPYLVSRRRSFAPRFASHAVPVIVAGRRLAPRGEGYGRGRRVRFYGTVEHR